MKKFFILIFLFASLFFGAIAQDVKVSQLGGSFNGSVTSIIADKKGNIYAAGAFTNAEGNLYVAKYDGKSWAEVGKIDSLASNSTISSLLFSNIGYLYAIATFIKPNPYNPKKTLSTPYVIQFDGNTWSKIGNVENFRVNEKPLAIDSKGNIYAYGIFKKSINNSRQHQAFAKWDGKEWSEVVIEKYKITQDYCITTDGLGNIFISAENNDEATSKSKNHILKYDGTNWVTIGEPLEFNIDNISSIAVDSKNNVYIGGAFVNENGENSPRKWDNKRWTMLGTGSQTANLIVCDNKDNVYGVVSGVPPSNGKGIEKLIHNTAYGQDSYFWENVGLYSIHGIWEGNLWGTNKIIEKIDGELIHTLCADSFGNIYVGGDFKIAEEGSTNFIAKYQSKSKK